MKFLRLSDDLVLPLDAVTQKLAFLGRTGSGKTYAATKLAELMLEHHAQIVALDPVGVWHGLRLGDGFDIPIFGGLKGDVPIEPTAGALLADLIVDRGISAVLDVSQMIASEQARFATDFATRFFQRKKASPSAVHLFLEECQEFVPQNVQRGEERMLHAFERLIKLGRNFGIGASLISQRPQEVNKKAINQAECLFAFQMTGPHERKAMKEWIASKAIDDDLDTILPRLAVGQPHVWSPQWLCVSKTIRVARKRSADASSTPEVGARVAPAKPLREIDLAQIRTDMAATIERAKAEDPRELRKRIAELERQLREAAKAQPPPATPVEVSVIADADLKRIEAVMNRLTKLDARFRADAEVLLGEATALRIALAKISSRPAVTVHAAQPMRPATAQAVRQMATTAVKHASGNGTDLPVGERAILTACAQYDPTGCARDQLSILTGYKRSTRDAYIKRLADKGLLTFHDSNVVATQGGFGALGADFEPLPTGRALQEYWLNRLPEGERKVFALAVAAHGKNIEREAIDAATEYRRSTRDAYIQRLIARRLVEADGRGTIRASSELFE